MSTIVDYYVGLKIHSSQEKVIRLRYLWVSIIFNLSLLGFFKYYNFFIDSWVDFLQLFGYNMQDVWTLNVILPIGISFYTFQTMTYSFDIYNKKLKPTKDFISYATYVGFFPQLVAGPIERASRLLPQIMKKREFSYVQYVQGLRLILWGMFKKVVIADSLAIRVNDIFNGVSIYDGGVLYLGVVYFAFQIYCDFSGYSDIAIGTAKLFGIELMSNFKIPYLSKNISEFWRRWHISLSSWFRDYMFSPLYIYIQGKRWAKRYSYKVTHALSFFIALFAAEFMLGLWHGAAWNFALFGVYHALVIWIYYYTRKFWDRMPNLFQIFFMFNLACVGWVIFRTTTISNAMNYLKVMVTNPSIPSTAYGGMVYVIILCSLDWLWRNNEREPLNLHNKYLRWTLYMGLMYLIAAYFEIIDASQFIYFQF